MDYSEIQKVIEETDVSRVQKYLNTKRWTILAISPGQNEYHEAYCLYSLGWYGPSDPDLPGEDHSEFPEELEERYI